MKRLRNILVAFGFIAFIASPVMAVAAPQSVAAAGDPTCEQRLLGMIPPWFRGLTYKDTSGQCQISQPDDVGGFIWKIALNIIEIGMFLVGYIAFFLILYGGFLFLTGGGVPSQIENARKTILNAVIGLAIALGSIAITNLIFGLLG